MAERTEYRIAVVGMACVFPGAHSPEELWQDVLAGRRTFRKAPSERLPLGSYYDPAPETPDKTYSDQLAVIWDWPFDPMEFQIPPVTFEATDPTHWLALWTARAALEHAGIDLHQYDRSRIGVVLGNTLGGEHGRALALRFRWPFVERALRRAIGTTGQLDPSTAEKLMDAFRQQYLAPIPRITEDTLAGAMSNTIAGRICSYFDLQGGGYTIDGACSSSLLAVAKACEALASGCLDLVITGGVDVSLDPFELVGFAKTQALATEDIRPYDARADGMLPGEGCGLVVLMREPDALLKNLTVHALIRGWGYSSDGRGAITAPRLEGQVLAMQRAYERAQYPMSSVDLIEGHGTGTLVGDHVELEAVLAMLGASTEEAHCRIGSIKGNIGHCKAAAGAAGLIKVIMALQRKILPPTSGCKYPNKLFGFAGGRLLPALTGEAWKKGQNPRRAAVSAFGFGGSNAHLTLEEANPDSQPRLADLDLLGSAQESELFLLSASDADALFERVKRLSDVAQRICRAELTDVAASLSRGEITGDFRIAVIATSPWQLVELLERAKGALASAQSLDSLNNPGLGLFAGVSPSSAPRRKLVALFPGQGVQRIGMGLQLSQRYRFVRRLYEGLDATIADILPEGTAQLVLKNPTIVREGLRKRWEEDLRSTRVCQPAVIIASLVTLRVLKYFGLYPDVFLGHSLGEITALCGAGAFDETTATRIGALRGAGMAQLPSSIKGAMAAMACDAESLSSMIAACGERVSISNYNSPGQTVISGTVEAVGEFLHACRQRGIRGQRLAVSHAFHSPLVAPMSERFREQLRNLALCPPRALVVSTVTGQLFPPRTDPAAHLANQVTAPVLFSSAVRCAQAQNPAMWVEVGPAGTLAGLVKEILQDPGLPIFVTDGPNADTFTCLNRVMAQAFVLGFPIRHDRLFSDRFFRSISIDRYSPRFILSHCERVPARPREESKPSQLVVPAPGAAPDKRATAIDFAIDWIARRTGYSASSISSDKRLRDDLNLDSIKAAELVQVLLSEYGHPVQPQPGWENLPIAELVDAVLDLDPPAASADGSSLLRVEGIREGDDWVRTFSPGVEEAPIDDEPALPVPDLPSAIVLASGDCRYANAVVDSLIDGGFAPVVMDRDELLRLHEHAPALGALVWLLPEAGGLLTATALSAFMAQVNEDALMLFRLARWLLTGPVGRSVPVRLLVLRPERAPAAPLPIDAGAALLKSLALEYPRLQAKWIRIPADFEPSLYGEIVANELRHGGQHGEYRYDQEGRRVILSMGSLTSEEGPGLTLNDRDVVLATGGAKGITAELACHLGTRYGVRLALIGRSPSTDESVQRSLQRFEQAGITTRYRTCDVTEARQVEEAVKLIQQELGPVTMVLHGAGISVPTAFRAMSLDAFSRCIGVKLAGLDNVLAGCPPEGLKAIHVLSSVLSYTGMSKQADYCAANAVLNCVIAEIKAAYPHLHALALAYSMWRDVGLAETLGVVKLLGQMGVGAIKPEQGVAAYQAALCRAPGNSQLVITGRLPQALQPSLFPNPRVRASRFHERVLRWIPGVEIIAESTLNSAQDACLREHVLNGTPMLPAVMGIEAMVSTAVEVAHGKVLPVLRDLEFLRPVIVPDGSTVDLRVYAFAGEEANGRVSVHTAIRTSTDGFSVDRFRATCEFGTPDSQLDVEPLETPLPPVLPLNLRELSRKCLFQGPLFQRVISVRRLEPNLTCLAEVSVPAEVEYFSDISRHFLKTPFPAARDAFFHTLLFLIGGPGILTRIRELHFFPSPLTFDTLICRTRRKLVDEVPYQFDIDVLTRDGRLVEALRGVEGMPVSLRAATASISPSELGPGLAERCDQLPHALETIYHRQTEFADPQAAQRELRASTLLAVKQSVTEFATAHPELGLEATTVEIAHDDRGKPQLQLKLNDLPMDQNIDVSISHSQQCSMAMIATANVGIDLEAVVARSSQDWLALLGGDGYALAERLVVLASEPFEVAATRVWTIIEASIKAFSHRPVFSDLNPTVDAPCWITMESVISPQSRFLSAWLRSDGRMPSSVFTLGWASARRSAEIEEKNIAQ